MLYVDIPTLPEIRALIAIRADACVSIYVSTTPQTQHVKASRIAFGNLTKSALQQLDAAGFDKRRRALLQAELAALGEDDAFWRLQAHSLAVLATPDSVRTFRLATAITDTAEVSDRFHLKPLLRAIAFPQHAFVLALSENAARLVEVFADLPPSPVRVADLPGTEPLRLAGTLVGTPHQSRIRQEVAHRGKTVDGVDLIEQDQGEDLADARNREESVIGVAIIDLGVTMQVEFDGANLFVVPVDKGQVGLDAELHRGIRELLGDLRI
jgi:hypothetical protein